MKRKDFMKLGVMFVCFSLAAGVPVVAAEQQPATKWQYTQKQEQDGILCVFDELKLKLPETWNGKFVTGVESGAIKRCVNAMFMHLFFLSEAIFPENMS